ncbi:MAG: hypothetical protein KDD41_11140 [Flavobacteriales bacterium]|nr:hypothetical protein [Flavobacteriales bacterium]
MKKLLLLVFVYAVPLLGIGQEANFNVNSYYGSWAETLWYYNFYENNTYSFKSEGHFGFTQSSGNYKISKDTLILNSVKSDTIPEDSYLEIKDMRFIILSDTCLIALGTGYEYCSTLFSFSKENDEEIMIFRGSRNHRLYGGYEDEIIDVENLNTWDKSRYLDEVYTDLIRSADIHFYYKKYLKSLEFYQATLKIKPNEQYPQQQIDKLKIILDVD